jgi:uncharacterized RDD family membrane protein YckC
MNAIAHASALSTSGPQLDNRRVLAALIDLMIVGAGAALILFAADVLPSGAGSAREEVGSGLYLIALAWALYYYFACESGGGQTLGKRAMKLRVVRADGGEAGMREIAVRTVLRVVDGIGLYLVGLIVMLASGKRRQRLGDMAGGTIVVDADASLAPAPPVPPASVTGVPMEPAVLSVPTVSLPEIEHPAVIEEPVVPEEPAALKELEPVALEEAEPVAVEEAEPVVVEELEPPVVVHEPEAVSEPAPAPIAAADPLVPFEPIMHEDARPEVAEEPLPEEPPADEPVVVRSVETVSAIDLVMGDEDEGHDPAEPAAGR